MPRNAHPSGVHDALVQYRSTAMGAGVHWTVPDVGPTWQPPDQKGVAAVFDAQAIPSDVIWLYTQCTPDEEVFPNGGSLLPWPVSSGDRRWAIQMLARSFGTPFPWRQQFPLVVTDHFVFTVVLHPGPRAGEVWRYEWAGDFSDPVRAARDVASLFGEWVRGVEADVLQFAGDLGQLVTDDALWAPGSYEHLPQRFADRDPSCDLRAYPESIPEWQLQEWQRECGVDVEYLAQYGGTETFVEFMEEVAAVADSL